VGSNGPLGHTPQPSTAFLRAGVNPLKNLEFPAVCSRARGHHQGLATPPGHGDDEPLFVAELAALRRPAAVEIERPALARRIRRLRIVDRQALRAHRLTPLLRAHEIGIERAVVDRRRDQDAVTADLGEASDILESTDAAACEQRDVGNRISHLVDQLEIEPGASANLL